MQQVGNSLDSFSKRGVPASQIIRRNWRFIFVILVEISNISGRIHLKNESFQENLEN